MAVYLTKNWLVIVRLVTTFGGQGRCTLLLLSPSAESLITPLLSQSHQEWKTFTAKKHESASICLNIWYVSQIFVCKAGDTQMKVVQQIVCSSLLTNTDHVLQMDSWLAINGTLNIVYLTVCYPFKIYTSTIILLICSLSCTWTYNYDILSHNILSGIHSASQNISSKSNSIHLIIQLNSSHKLPNKLTCFQCKKIHK